MEATNDQKTDLLFKQFIVNIFYTIAYKKNNKRYKNDILYFYEKISSLNYYSLIPTASKPSIQFKVSGSATKASLTSEPGVKTFA